MSIPEYIIEHTRYIRAIPGAWLVVLLLGMAFLGCVWWLISKANERIER